MKRVLALTALAALALLTTSPAAADVRLSNDDEQVLGQPFELPPGGQPIPEQSGPADDGEEVVLSGTVVPTAQPGTVRTSAQRAARAVPVVAAPTFAG